MNLPLNDPPITSEPPIVLIAKCGAGDWILSQVPSNLSATNTDIPAKKDPTESEAPMLHTSSALQVTGIP